MYAYWRPDAICYRADNLDGDGKDAGLKDFPNGAALVLGGASGIGAAAARALAAQDHALAIADLEEGGAAMLAAELGEPHLGLPVDLADEHSIERCFESAERHLGPVRVLVVAGGVPGLIEGARPTLRETTAESWDQVLNVNARGTFLAIRTMLRRRTATAVDHGRIVTIASMAAQMPPRNAPASYASSKGAVLVLTRVAAVEAATLGMTVNAIAPGVIDTPMLRATIPDDSSFSGDATILENVGQPEDVASAVAFLASRESCFINGACIDVNGGAVMR